MINGHTCKRCGRHIPPTEVTRIRTTIAEDGVHMETLCNECMEYPPACKEWTKA